MAQRLWQTTNRPDERRLPVRINQHDRFVGGRTITIVGTRWSRTWGILPAGTKLDEFGHPDWLGGMSWRTKYSSLNVGPTMALTRPTLALCKWRYR